MDLLIGNDSRDAWSNFEGRKTSVLKFSETAAKANQVFLLSDRLGDLFYVWRHMPHASCPLHVSFMFYIYDVVTILY